MSRRYSMTHTNARAVTLTEFGFALIRQARISCVAPPTEMEFRISTSSRRMDGNCSTQPLPHVQTPHHSEPQDHDVEWYEQSSRPDLGSYLRLNYWWKNYDLYFNLKWMSNVHASAHRHTKERGEYTNIPSMRKNYSYASISSDRSQQ